MCSGFIIGRLTPPFFVSCRIRGVYQTYTIAIRLLYVIRCTSVLSNIHSIIRYPRTISESTDRPIRCRTTYQAIEPIGLIRTTERTNHLIERTNRSICTIEPIDDRPSYLYRIERVNRQINYNQPTRLQQIVRTLIRCTHCSSDISTSSLILVTIIRYIASASD
jgi:hypothetical protein